MSRRTCDTLTLFIEWKNQLFTKYCSCSLLDVIDKMHMGNMLVERIASGLEPSWKLGVTVSLE